MFKKIMKTALVASLVFSFSTSAIAEATIWGQAAQYFGQVDPGIDGQEARIDQAGEAKLKFSATTGSLTGFIQLIFKDDAGYYDNNFDDGNLYNGYWNVQYKSDNFVVKLGTVDTADGCTYAYGNGLLHAQTFLIFGTYVRCYSYREQDGLQVSYNIPSMKGALSLTFYPTSTGQATAVSANGKIANMIEFKANYLSDMKNNYDTTADTSYTNTEMHIGLKANLGSPKVTLSYDYSSLFYPEVDGGWTQQETIITSNALQFRVNDLGPGAAILTYASEEKKLNEEDFATYINAGLTYRFTLVPGAYIPLFYSSFTTDYEDETVDDVTSTAFGAGLEIFF